jgi:hypothetical protein
MSLSRLSIYTDWEQVLKFYMVVLEAQSFYCQGTKNYSDHSFCIEYFGIIHWELKKYIENNRYYELDECQLRP